MTDLNVDKLTPPPELVQQWAQYHDLQEVEALWRTIATQAARWGADQELEACLLWVGDGRRENLAKVIQLRDHRRPKPPSLKEQALRLVADYGVPFYRYTAEQTETIRRALEALPND